MARTRLFITALLLAAAILACALPAVPSQVNDAATAVVQTMQALAATTPLASPSASAAPVAAATNTPAVQATASPQPLHPP